MPFITRKSLLGIVLLLAVAVVLLLGFLWSGLYNVGADDPHTRPMLAMMETLRENSIHARSKSLQPPNLDDPQLILKGAGQYAAMCTGCHLAPGMEDSEIRPGLYPQPPELSKVRVDPKDAFWVIKHGVKMSAMPAWGGSHDDPTIWSMVAFLRKLPDLTPAQYKDIVAKAPPDEDMEGGHHHHGGEADEAHHDEADSADHEHAHEHGSEPEAPALEGYSANAVPDGEAIARAFHAALESGDRQRALGLLSPDVVISEGGEAQSYQQYAGGHLGEDIAFLKQARVKPVFLGSMAMGAMPMVASRSEIHTTHDGKAVVILSTEILTLKRTPSGLRIAKVEWASEKVTSQGARP